FKRDDGLSVDTTVSAAATTMAAAALLKADLFLEYISPSWVLGGVQEIERSIVARAAGGTSRRKCAKTVADHGARDVRAGNGSRERRPRQSISIRLSRLTTGRGAASSAGGSAASVISTGGLGASRSIAARAAAAISASAGGQPRA